MESKYFNEWGWWLIGKIVPPSLKKLEEQFIKDGGSYKKYKISDLFEVVGTKSLDEGKLNFVNEGINFVGRVTENNGIKGKINQQLFEPNEPFTITASVIGNYKYVKYQLEPYYCSQNINKLIPKFEINDKLALYFITLIQKFVSKYNGQQGGYKLLELQNHKISIPINSNNEYDFKFMENCISELEEERISELTAYLKVSGLDNYELSNDEINAIAEFKNSKFKEFSIAKDIFEVNNTHNILSSWIVPNSGKIPYVTASEKNNSISTYIDYDKDMIEKGNNIMIGGKTLVISYQPNDYFSNDSHNLSLYLKEKERANTETMLYLVSSLYKSLKPIYTWGDSISKKKIQKDTITLPIKENGSINYDLMSLFIKAQEKLVIKDVVIWKDKIINKTKDLIIN